ncbi:hypothetical protein IT403_01945 [Candidatus Nomurabacteria bacterium]|nr:hypothetical protein [Candidatus Nomurabacteria bacterium]
MNDTQKISEILPTIAPPAHMIDKKDNNFVEENNTTNTQSGKKIAHKKKRASRNVLKNNHLIDF